MSKKAGQVTITFGEQAYLTLEEACDEFKIPRELLVSWIEDGQLRAVHITHRADVLDKPLIRIKRGELRQVLASLEFQCQEQAIDDRANRYLRREPGDAK